jgi:U3 small nucleolar ribonucleoprotein protein IMP4
MTTSYGGHGILFTTSRAPSPRTRSLVKELASLVPGGTRLTRGHLTLDEIAAIARVHGADRVTILGERRGNPSIIRVYKVTNPPDPPGLINIVTIIVRGVSLARERGVRRPPRPEVLYVEASEGGEEYAEALIRAWHARLLRRGVRYKVKVVIEARGEDAIIDFRDTLERPAGPRLRVSKPRRMIKDADP